MYCIMKRFILSIVTLLSLASCQAQSVAEKAASLLIVGVDGQSLSADNHIVSDIRDKGVAGIILFGHNVATTATCDDPRGQLKQFVSDLKSLRSEPLLIAIDQEGGYVNRLKPASGFLPMISHFDAAASGDLDSLRAAAATIASEVASIGINLNFAPCVDVNVNPECPVIGRFERSFSADEELVADYARIYVEEHHKRGVLTSLKHFPGHGNSLADSHFGLTDITNTWSEKELTPYRELMASGDCDAVMVSHLFNRNIDPNYPATLSRATLQGVLRNELGWGGAIITDDMQMQAITDHYGFDEAVVLALNAGVDLFIVGNNIYKSEYNIVDKFIEIVEAAVANGEISMDTLNQAVERANCFVMRAK